MENKFSILISILDNRISNDEFNYTLHINCMKCKNKQDFTELHDVLEKMIRFCSKNYRTGKEKIARKHLYWVENKILELDENWINEIKYVGIF